MEGLAAVWLQVDEARVICCMRFERSRGTRQDPCCMAALMAGMELVIWVAEEVIDCNRVIKEGKDVCIRKEIIPYLYMSLMIDQPAQS